MNEPNCVFGGDAARVVEASMAKTMVSTVIRFNCLNKVWLFILTLLGSFVCSLNKKVWIAQASDTQTYLLSTISAAWLS
jgi:hypothetical protein